MFSVIPATTTTTCPDPALSYLIDSSGEHRSSTTFHWGLVSLSWVHRRYLCEHLVVFSRSSLTTPMSAAFLKVSFGLFTTIFGLKGGISSSLVPPCITTPWTWHPFAHLFSRLWYPLPHNIIIVPLISPYNTPIIYVNFFTPTLYFNYLPTLTSLYSLNSRTLTPIVYGLPSLALSWPHPLFSLRCREGSYGG